VLLGITILKNKGLIIGFGFGFFTFGIICQPDVKLGNEQFQTELTKPSKEIGEPLLKNWMTISQPQKPKYLVK
jgi:hypothetical protein